MSLWDDRPFANFPERAEADALREESIRLRQTAVELEAKLYLAQLRLAERRVERLQADLAVARWALFGCGGVLGVACLIHAAQGRYLEAALGGVAAWFVAWVGWAMKP